MQSNPLHRRERSEEESFKFEIPKSFRLRYLCISRFMALLWFRGIAGDPADFHIPNKSREGIIRSPKCQAPSDIAGSGPLDIVSDKSVAPPDRDQARRPMPETDPPSLVGHNLVFIASVDECGPGIKTESTRHLHFLFGPKKSRRDFQLRISVNDLYSVTPDPRFGGITRSPGVCAEAGYY